MNFKILYFYAFSMLSFTAFSQADFSANHQKITNALTDYFNLDRENIHLHLNKNVYLTNEEIRFKGYIIEKKYKPTLMTSNIFVNLLDSNGKIVDSQLYYADAGIFEGHIKLNKKIETGRYYLQVYTNFMNNFSEDESSVYGLYIQNNAQKSYRPSDALDYQTTDVSFFPESQIFLAGVSNVVGIRIADCNGHGIEQKGRIVDSKGEIISTFTTDQFGYGKFEMSVGMADLYTAVLTIDGKTVEKALPKAAKEGIAFTVVNYTLADKTTIKIKTNPATLDKIKNEKYTLVFQQNESAVFADFSFSDKMYEQVLYIPNNVIPEGINTVYLIDKNLKKLGERIIYKPSVNPNKTLLNVVRKTSDSIMITGSSPIMSGNLSISVLPEKTISENPSHSIQSDLQFDNYLKVPSQHTRYYLQDFSRRKHYELDNFLLSETSKYDWGEMLSKAPEKKYAWDNGLTIKGTINSDIKSNKEFLINLNSLPLGLNEFASLNEKNEFVFENILAQDSTKMYFVAIDHKVKKPEVKIYSQFLNNKRAFMKPIQPTNQNCRVVEGEEIPLPIIDHAILLDSITIVNKKNKLVNQNKMGNLTSSGYKISDADAANYRDLLYFIKNHGFTVTTKDGNTRIQSYSESRGPAYRNKIQMESQFGGPAVYIDGQYVQNYDLLADYSLTTIDEIYINKSGYDMSARGSSGIIKIYTKKNFGQTPDSSKKTAGMFVKGGFQVYKPFVNPKYDNVKDDGFLKLGTIDWKPFIETDSNGTFHFSIVNLNQKSIKLVIEGISPDGKMISETIALEIP